ncbi:hypothetical protein L1049_019177 [Liquidambar formosana]|uniref:DUF3741 domain-containing protein n=1 Tax=Liquidambar formosana TaxID=63359 RepID=A0AAP0RD46_LIQFO
MKDLSLFLLKNTLGAKMKKGIRSFCNGDGSTSTLNQRKTPSDDRGRDSSSGSCMVTPESVPLMISSPNLAESHPPTLEEMILQLELEEGIAGKAKLHHDYGELIMQRRRSCVNNSDILRSARNALNQYPRFSLDGKDAMYRSSFLNLSPTITTAAGRKSICCNRGLLRDRFEKKGTTFNSKLDKSVGCLPPTLAGERVIWCKPGVVAKLMGLEVMPVPILSSNVVQSSKGRRKLSSIMIKKQNLRRIAERHEMERRRLVVDQMERRRLPRFL